MSGESVGTFTQHDLIRSGDAQVDDDRQDQHQKNDAVGRRAELQATVRLVLRRVITD
ncbi:hypothetical protein [Deinococcus sp.]|uniref:hypothetical protein n=1 Tax=Deinococcus sp. TaxID=47478 RepID=UPI0025E228EB|nr:hypothetical protein [Deinococcus sp.]